jgi:DNA-binding NtrC family response regulator
MGKKILIVDDDAALRYGLHRFLAAHGYEVCEAPNGVQALEILKGYAADLIITDYMMPEMNGLELLESLQVRWPRPRVLLLTGYFSADAAVGILEGRAEFLPKPVTLERLLSTVRRLFPSMTLRL